MKKILILAANPRKDLRLDHEIRDLQRVIERSQNDQQFEVIPELSVQIEYLQEFLFKHQPQIVHFCGHGSGEQGLVFETEKGGEQWVRTDALSDLFRLFEKNIECVLLNACYSQNQADAIINHIDYVIGMNQEIRDDAAIAFSKGFYRALGYDCGIERAFEFGCNAIRLEVSGSSKMRSLNGAARSASTEERKAIVENIVEKTAIPEHLKPILKIKPYLSAQPKPEPEISKQKKRIINQEIDQDLEKGESEQVKIYRNRVKQYLADHKLTITEEVSLEILQEDLKLSKTEADRILEEELAPIHRARENYRSLLNRLIERGHYPFDSQIKEELIYCQQEEKLTDEEVKEIETPILQKAEEDYQEKLKQEHQAKLHCYRDFLNRLIERGSYPFDINIEAELKKFQQEEKLTDEEVTEIETPILEKAEENYQQKLKQEHEAKLHRYRNLLNKLIERGSYPFDINIEAELKQFQQEQQLTDEEVKEIEIPILQKAERDYQEKLRQEEEQRRQEIDANLAKYENDLRKAVEAEYPLNQFVKDGLRNYQQSLGLSDVDVEKIETPILQKAERDYQEKIRRQSENNRREEANQSKNNYQKVITENLGNGITLEMVLIPAGSFMMGSNESDQEKPIHKVTLEAFCMGKYPITQAQYQAVMGNNPSGFKGWLGGGKKKYKPVEQVSWHDAKAFCQKLLEMTGRKYRLPSEAEWEYACRAGSKTKWCFGDNENDLKDYAWYKDNSNSQTHPVGEKKPNHWGLYDMHGNVWEWCEDDWHSNYENAPDDGTSWMDKSSEYVVLRGGCWNSNPNKCCSAYRINYARVNVNNSIGFRVVCDSGRTL